MGCDFKNAPSPTILEGELEPLGVLNSSLGPRKVLRVWKVNSGWGLPFALLPLELRNVH